MKRLTAPLCCNDFMGRAVAYGRGLRILRQDPWEALVSFLVSQCNNIPRIRRHHSAHPVPPVRPASAFGGRDSLRLSFCCPDRLPVAGRSGPFARPDTGPSIFYLLPKRWQAVLWIWRP